LPPSCLQTSSLPRTSGSESTPGQARPGPGNETVGTCHAPIQTQPIADCLRLRKCVQIMRQTAHLDRKEVAVAERRTSSNRMPSRCIKAMVRVIRHQGYGSCIFESGASVLRLRAGMRVSKYFVLDPFQGSA